MSLVNNLQFPPLLLFLRFSQVPTHPLTQTKLILHYSTKLMLRQTLCAHYSAKKETEREREKAGEEKRKKLDTILRAVGFFVVSFCKPKRKRSKRCRRKWWVGEESKENKTKHMKGTFFCFFFNIIFMLSKILWEIWFLQQITYSLYDLDQIKYIYYNYF